MRNWPAFKTKDAGFRGLHYGFGEVGFSVGAESDDELGVSERMLEFMLAFYELYPSLLQAPLSLAAINSVLEPVRQPL